MHKNKLNNNDSVIQAERMHRHLQSKSFGIGERKSSQLMYVFFIME